MRRRRRRGGQFGATLIAPRFFAPPCSSNSRLSGIISRYADSINSNRSSFSELLISNTILPAYRISKPEVGPLVSHVILSDYRAVSSVGRASAF